LAVSARADAPHADRDDEWLAARCRDAHDEHAFAEIVRRYREPVFRLAVSVLGQAFVPEAEDVAQDVMLRVHRGLGAFRGDARLGTWIYRVAFNHALNVKARMRFRTPHVSDAVLAAAPATDRNPHDRLDADQRQRTVLDAIGELPEIYQSALRLHYWLGASISDIAVMLDAPENTVKSYLHRARRLLHAHLTERGFDA
jgi:RNA polymerase sigma-70 factor (ECF subfamily)